MRGTVGHGGENGRGRVRAVASRASGGFESAAVIHQGYTNFGYSDIPPSTMVVVPVT